MDYYFFAYMRRSTKKEEQAESLLQQEEWIKNIATKLGIPLSKIRFFTESKSWFENRTRREWGRMIGEIDELAKKSKKCILICRDSSRLSRNQKDNLIISDRLFWDNDFFKKPVLEKIFMLGDNMEIREWDKRGDKESISNELHNNYIQSLSTKKKSYVGKMLRLESWIYPLKSPHWCEKVNTQGLPRQHKKEVTILKQNKNMFYIKRIFEMKVEGKPAKVMSEYLKKNAQIYIAPKKIIETIISNTVYKWEYTDPISGTKFIIKFWEWLPPITQDLWNKANASIWKRWNGYGEKQSEHLFLWKIKTQDGTTFQIYTAKGKTGKWQHLNYKWTIKNEKGKVVNVYISETNILQFLSEEISHIARKIMDKFDSYKKKIVHNQTLDDLYENLRSLPEFMNVEEHELRIRTLELKEAFDSYLEEKMSDNNLTGWKYENFANLITGARSNEIDTGSAILSLTAEKTAQMNDDLFHKTNEMQSYFMNIMALRNSVIEEVFADSPFINDLKKELSNQEEAIEKLKADKSALESEIKGVYEKAFKLGFKREFADDEAKKMEERLNQIDVAINELEGNSKLSDLLDKLPGIMAKIVELSSQALWKAKLRERREEIKLILEIIWVELQIDNKKELKIKLFEGLEGMLDDENWKWSHERELNPWPHPYHGCALPSELSRHGADYIVCIIIAKFFASRSFFVQCRLYETLCFWYRNDWICRTRRPSRSAAVYCPIFRYSSRTPTR